MKKSILAAALVVVIVIAGAGAYYALSSAGGTTTMSSTGVQIASDNLTITGPSTGTWLITIRNTGTVPVSSITVYLLTPTRTFVCSGAQQSDGLFFKNCPPPIGNPLPPGSTVSGNSTGARPASGTPGTTYTVAAHLAFANGQSTWVNSTVTAKSS